jgi:hypothetical protein
MWLFRFIRKKIRKFLTKYTFRFRKRLEKVLTREPGRIFRQQKKFFLKGLFYVYKNLKILGERYYSQIKKGGFYDYRNQSRKQRAL